MPYNRRGDIYSANFDKVRFMTVDSHIDTFVAFVGNGIISGWNVKNTADYYFIFMDDRLSEWGTGEVRVSQSNSGMILFMPITQ